MPLLSVQISSDDGKIAALRAGHFRIDLGMDKRGRFH